MHRFQAVRIMPLVFALALGFGWPLALSGCGGDDDGELVVPETPPEEKAKASMDYYINNQLKNAPQR